MIPWLIIANGKEHAAWNYYINLDGAWFGLAWNVRLYMDLLLGDMVVLVNIRYHVRIWSPS
jgi:hypothetical protein